MCRLKGGRESVKQTREELREIYAPNFIPTVGFHPNPCHSTSASVNPEPSTMGKVFNLINSPFSILSFSSAFPVIVSPAFDVGGGEARGFLM